MIAMKTLKTTFIILALGLFSITAVAQEKKEKSKKIETIEIQTSAICGMCEERIENDLAYAKGVKYVELDDKTKIVTVEYKTSKTNPDEIRKAISKIGYDADDVEADPVAYEKLPACCKKGNEPH
jgi:copper chaperone CopZ